VIVIGMAGHVDHGKTALVRALTGIDTDRLPEEKARGMTTDLGFAAMRLEGIDFAIVDVPGHERYIRNMVAGAWALDLALLVVAADDGWMNQTENHSRVLAALGPPRVVIAITKADKVAAVRLGTVIADVRNRACRIFGEKNLAAIVPTSAATGNGLEDLKESLVRESSHFRNPASASLTTQPKSFLCIDRIFMKKGAGLIACGSLKGGRLVVDDELVLFPAEEVVRIKGIECLGRQVPAIEGPVRVALNLSKPRSALSRGNILATAGKNVPEIWNGTEFLMRVEELPSSGFSEAWQQKHTLEGEVEVAAGTADRIAGIAPIGKGPWYRIVCREALAVPAGTPLAIIRHGGAEVLARGRIIAQGKTDRSGRKRLGAALLGLETFEDPALLALVLAIRLSGKARAGQHSPLNTLGALGLKELGIVIEGDIAWNSERYVRELKARSLLRSTPETQAHTDAEPLSPELLTAEKALHAAGRQGLDYSTPQRVARKLIDRLCDKGVALPLDRDLFIHRTHYLELVRATLAGLNPRDRLDIGMAKDRTGYSRKFILPFLNRMERDGYVKRDGDGRIVLKLPTPR
jgi:selenocysteine-specific elongation factor